MTREWRRAIELGIETGAIAPEAAAAALREIDAHVRGTPTVADVASWSGVTADVMEGLLDLAQSLPPAPTAVIDRTPMAPSTALTHIDSGVPGAIPTVGPVAAGPPKKALHIPALTGSLGRYRIVRELGHGGMGVVYQAHDELLGREVALKVLLVGGRVDEEAIDRFEREAKAAAALEHPNIIRVHDVGRLPADQQAGLARAGGLPYYTMELLHGQDLAHAIADDAVTPRDAAEVVGQVALALAYAHHKGILHRDIKPQNVFLRAAPEGEDPPTVPGATMPRAGDMGRKALLLDFGLAKLTEHDLSSEDLGSRREKSVKTLTQTGQILGTPTYMAPEQARGEKEIDARADIYSLGATLYQALTGVPPFCEPTLANLLYAVQKKDPTPPRRVDPDIEVDLETICLACLAKEPKDRYQTAADLAEDCRRYLDGEPISRRPIGSIGRVWRRAKRHKAVAIPVALLAIGVLAALSYWGGGAILRAHRLATLESEFRRKMEAGDCRGAARAAEAAAELAPNDARYREQRGMALYEAAARPGREELARYRDHREKAAQCLIAAGHDGDAEEPQDPTNADARRRQRWNAEQTLRREELEREDAWARAAVSFTEALTYRREKEALSALTELYWDKYLEAEHARDFSAMGVYESHLVEFGGAPYERELRGEREVRVTFLLPDGYAGNEVSAYVSQFLPADAPPVLVPVPYDLAHGRPLQGQSAELAEDPQAWKPLPLVQQEAAAAAPPPLDPSERQRIEGQAKAAFEGGRYAEALPLLDLLTRRVAPSGEHAWRLARCLAQGAHEKDPYAWLVAGAGQETIDALQQRTETPSTTSPWTRLEEDAVPFEPGATQETWRAWALLAIEEAARRGWSVGGSADPDKEFASLREEGGFTLLCSVLRGETPRKLVWIEEVGGGSQAQTLGLRAGDVILSIDGHAVGDPDQARKSIRGVGAGQPYEVIVRRGNDQVRAQAKGGGVLGVVIAEVDISTASPTRFPWKGAEPADDGVARTRARSVFQPALRDESRIALPVLRDSKDGRPRLDLSLRLLRGSYLLFIPAGQGLYETHYPIDVSREYSWREVCELVADTDVPALPPGLGGEGAGLEPGFWRYIPAGPYRASGDPKAYESPKREAAVIRLPERKPLSELGSDRAPQGYFMSRFEVTWGMYTEYLNDREWHTAEVAARHSPREGESLRPDARGVFKAGEMEELPLFFNHLEDDLEYCRWLEKKAGRDVWEFIVPTEDEWEKAARGPDGRCYPWGDSFDATFCSTEGSPSISEPDPVGLFPVDESPYGVRDLAGSMFEMTTTTTPRRAFIIKGGTAGKPRDMCRSAFRSFNFPTIYGGTFRILARRAK